MALIKKFEDIIGWQEARELVKEIYRVCPLGYSRRSAVEVQSLLYAALDIDYINQVAFDAQYQQAEKAKALIGG